MTVIFLDLVVMRLLGMHSLGMRSAHIREQLVVDSRKCLLHLLSVNWFMDDVVCMVGNFGVNNFDITGFFVDDLFFLLFFEDDLGPSSLLIDNGLLRFFFLLHLPNKQKT